MLVILNTYNKKLFFLTLILLVFSALLEGVSGYQFLNRFTYYVIIFLAILSYFTHLLVMKGFAMTPLDAQNYFMLSSSLKIVISGIALFCYFYFIKIERVTFLLNFFLIYFVYSFFEIKTLLLSLHPNSKGDQKEDEKNV
jgi:hypothetical protein